LDQAKALDFDFCGRFYMEIIQNLQGIIIASYINFYQKLCKEWCHLDQNDDFIRKDEYMTDY
jgi:hypothetical protein